MSDYRYTLTRQVAPLTGTGVLCWIMLNPSTADDHVDDPTMRRVIRFTRDHGYAELEVVNLFALRATNPDQLLAHHAPAGARNPEAIKLALARADDVVFAWGAWWSGVPLERRPSRICPESIARRFGHKPLCLGVTKDGSPRHPLYVPADRRLVAF